MSIFVRHESSIAESPSAVLPSDNYSRRFSETIVINTFFHQKFLIMTLIVTASRLKTIYKAFKRFLEQFLASVDHLGNFASVSQHFLANVDSTHLKYYLKEFYVRMAYIFDIQDTLEFGRLRTDSQALLHNNFLEPVKVGCYMAVPHDSDKLLRLTSCSHEGIQYWLNKLEESTKASSDSETLTFIENMSLNLVNASNKLTTSRKHITELTLSTILDAFHVRKPKNAVKLEPKNLLMTAYHGYSLTFYQVVSNEKVWTTWNLFPELILAAGGEDGDERDFRTELAKAQYLPSSQEYTEAHNDLIVRYEQIQQEKVSKRAEQDALNAKHKLDKVQRQIKSKAAVESQQAELALITDPEELAAINASEEKGRRRAKRCFDESAGADGSNGSSSSSSDSDESRKPVKSITNKQQDKQKKNNSKKVHKHVKLATQNSEDRVRSEVSSNVSPSTSQLQSAFPVVNEVEIASSPSVTLNSTSCAATSKFVGSGVIHHKVTPDTKHLSNEAADDMFSGVAIDESRLHEADVGSDLDSDDCELDFDNPGALFGSATKSVGKKAPKTSSQKPTSSSHSSRKNSSKTKTPEKLAAEISLLQSKELKLEVAKKKRDDLKTERRMELANFSLETIDGSGKKKRAPCAISSDTVAMYKSDFDLNRLTAKSLSVTLIADAMTNVIGTTINSSEVETFQQNQSSQVLLSSAEKLHLLDRNFKDGLMNYCQLELLKDVTFERLLVNYCIAKREATGVADDEILDIDWFEVMTGFRLSLEKRLIDGKETVLNAIKLAIDGIVDEDLTSLNREAEKDKYVASAEAWVKHGLRMIRGVVNKSLNKIGAYWESLNFLPPGALKSTIVSAGGNKSSLFASITSHYNTNSSNSSCSSTVTSQNAVHVGIDSLMYQVIRSSKHETDDEHMDKLIKYTKISRDRYKIIPHNQVAMETWLVDNQKTSSDGGSSAGENVNNIGDTTTPLSSQLLKSIHSGPGDSFISPSSPATRSTDSGDSSSCSVVGGNSLDDITNTTRKLLSLSVSSTPPVYDSGTDIKTCLNESAKFHMKELLKVMYAGVLGQDANMCLKVNALSNSRKIEVMSFMRFLESCESKSIEQVAIIFAESIYFKNFTCNFFIPFSNSDRSNIIGDGYCFYRTLYVLYVRSLDGAYEMSGEEMKTLDLGLRSVENDARSGFYDFFSLLHGSLPEEYGKSRVLQSRFLFFHIMNCSLDQRFWGVLDGVAYLPFECSGFGEHDDPLLSALWVKYYCSSIFGMNNGGEIDSGTVGSSPTFADVALVLSRQPNYAMFKNNHFFVSDHRSSMQLQSSFDKCLEMILGELQVRFKIASGSSRDSSSDAVVSWSSVCDRMEAECSTDKDIEYLRAATECLVRELQLKEVLLQEEAERQKASNKRGNKIAERAPMGATEDQRKLFVLTTKYKDAKHKLESLQSELEGIKRMIQKNLIAKEQAVDLVTDEDVIEVKVSTPHRPADANGSSFLTNENNMNCDDE